MYRGKIDNEKIIYLYNLNEDGEPGFDIINPINIENRNFLINRGWVKLNDKNKPFITKNENFVGILREKSKSSYFKPENDLSDNYWFKLEDVDFNVIASDLGVGTHTIYLRFQDDTGAWSIPKKQVVTVSNPFDDNYDTPPIAAAEYYINTFPFNWFNCSSHF